jgi:ABC-2 type transport system ATP-binding protein
MRGTGYGAGALWCKREPRAVHGYTARVIDAQQLGRTYRVNERKAGLLPALRSLFHRTYREVAAVSDLSFKVAEGECVGFLGPNGAGKTTTLKMLAGLLHPTSGRVTVAGYVPQQRDGAFLRSVTLVMGQKQQLLWDLPPVETYALNRAVYGIPRDRFERTLTRLTELLDAGAVVGRPTRQLSLGERMKCELIAALLHEPRVLFLDEPTIGLDVTAQGAVRDFIRKYNAETGATVLLTSHDMDDVRALCPRVMVIDKGRLLHDGPLEALARRVRSDKRVRARFSGSPRTEGMPGGARVTVEGPVATYTVDASHTPDLVRWLMAGADVADFTVEDPPLDEVMRQLFAQTRPAASADAGAAP